MDVAPLRQAYRAFIETAAAGGFSPPPAGEWSAAQVIAHIAANDDLLAAATAAVLDGDAQAYYNHESIDTAKLDQLIAERAGMAALIEWARRNGERLCSLADVLGDRAATAVPVHIKDGAAVIADGPMPWGRVLEIHAIRHLPNHTRQLESLRTG